MTALYICVFFFFEKTLYYNKNNYANVLLACQLQALLEVEYRQTLCSQCDSPDISGISSLKFRHKSSEISMVSMERKIWSVWKERKSKKIGKLVSGHGVSKLNFLYQKYIF